MNEPQLYLDINKANPGTPPPPAGGGKGGGAGPKVVYEYWGNRPGTPDPADGWEQTEGGGWKRPEGMGGRGAAKKAPEEKTGKPTAAGAKEQAVEPTVQDKLQEQTASQNPVKELVSSGEGKQESVSSPAAKLEAKKQSSAERPTIPIPAEDQIKIQANPAEMAKVEMDRLRSSKDTAPETEDQKVEAEAQKQLDNEKTVKEAAEKKPKKEKKAKESRPPANAKDKLLLERHNDQVNSLKENIESHIRWNKDLSADEKKKLKTVTDALSAHGTLKNLPEREHKQVLTAAKQVAGQYGKKRHETKGVKAPKETKPKKKTAKQQLSRIEAATGKKAKTSKKPVSPEQSRLRGKDEPPPLPSQKKQEQMRKEVDRQKKKEATAKEREKKAEENKKAREQAQWDKKIEAAKQKIRENTEAPNSPEGVQEQQAFKNDSKTLADNIRHHLENSDIDDNKRTQLENTLQILDTHSELTGLPSKEQKKAQSTAKKLAGEHGKPPKEAKGDKEPKEKKKRPTPVGKWMRAGYQAGQAAGQAATTPEAAGGAVEAPAYAARGAAGLGHHLLTNRKVDKDNAEAKKQAKKTPKKGAEVEQSAMNKSLGLYIDLNKALGGSGPAGTTNTPPPERAKQKHEASYAKQPTGIANEGLVQDNDDDDNEEEVEKKVKDKVKKSHDGISPYTEKEPVEDEDVSTESADNNHVFSTPNNSEPETWAGSKMEGVDTQRSFYEINSKASNILKSLNKSISDEIKAATPSSLEAEFMVQVLGHKVSDVRKGLCFIKGKDRHRFNEWAADRLSKSITNLHKRIS